MTRSMNAAAVAELSSSSCSINIDGSARVRLDVVGLVAEPLEADAGNAAVCQTTPATGILVIMPEQDDLLALPCLAGCQQGHLRGAVRRALLSLIMPGLRG